MKNYAQAAADYGIALQIDPEYASSLYGRGLAEQSLGNTALATAEMTKAERNKPDVAAAFAR